MLGANATTTMPREPPARPPSIQGRRMPIRDEVRSLILPKNGLAKIASREPVPVDERQAARCPVDPDQRVDLEGEGDQQGGDEHQRGPQVGQRVQRDESPTDPTPAEPSVRRRLGCRLRLAAHH